MILAFRFGSSSDETVATETRTAAGLNARRHLHHALRFVRGDNRPIVLLAGGLPGSGKTTLARALASAIGARVVSADETRKLETAADLKGMVLAHPFRGIEGGNGEWDYPVPMLPGEHVTDDAGTGFVHTAPSHGDDDYQLGVKFGLPMTYNVEADGSYRTDLPLFGGQAIITAEGKEGPANVSNIKAMHGAGALFAKVPREH